MCIMNDKRIKPSVKGLYAYLCKNIDSANNVIISRKEICEDLSISNETLGKYLNILAESGYIERTQLREEGRFSCNEYRIKDAILWYTLILAYIALP